MNMMPHCTTLTGEVTKPSCHCVKQDDNQQAETPTVGTDSISVTSFFLLMSTGRSSESDSPCRQNKVLDGYESMQNMQ